MEVLQANEVRWKSKVERIVGEVEIAESGNVGDFRRDGTGELVGGDGEVEEQTEMTNLRGESSGEIKPGDVKRNDMATRRIAGDAIPSAMVSGDIPGCQSRLWVGGDGGFDGEQRLVFRHAGRSCSEGRRMEQEKEQEKITHFLSCFAFTA